MNWLKKLFKTQLGYNPPPPNLKRPKILPPEPPPKEYPKIEIIIKREA